MFAPELIVSLALLAFHVPSSWSASVYTSLSLPKTNVESLCSPETETRVTSEGKESSLILDLNPGTLTHGFCKRTLIAPESHGFFIRLAYDKGGKMQSGSSSAKNLHGMASKVNSSTNSCPLSIFTSNEQAMMPWRIDPCNLENSREEQMKFLPGRFRIVWDHGGNVPNFKLIITSIGKGLPCQGRNKFPCLRFGAEALLCISKDLVCDGVRHCPKGTSYDSDEDPEICARHKKDGLDNEFWEKLTMELFRNFLTTDVPVSTTKLPEKLHVPKDEKTVQSTNVESHIKRNNTRSSIAGDLSKYGPWGYLMLGMLLCGGALLICGLWECCCRQNKSSDTNIAGSTLPANGTDEVTTPTITAPDIRPPNYEELDPPPSYSVLFPNQKETINPDTGSNNDPNTNSDSSNQTRSS